MGENHNDLEGITTQDSEPKKILNLDGIDTPVAEVKEFEVSETGADTNGRIYYPEGEGPLPVMPAKALTDMVNLYVTAGEELTNPLISPIKSGYLQRSEKTNL